MTLNVLRFASVMLTAVAMAAGFAHLLELPNKIGLSRDDYLTVQQIYRGWALLGIVVVGALVSTAALAVQVRRTPVEFYLTAAATLCIALTRSCSSCSRSPRTGKLQTGRCCRKTGRNCGGAGSTRTRLARACTSWRSPC